jgi:purine nucleosidase
MERFLIDTDTASDDAVALVMALKNPNIKVEAITVVAGNVPLEQATQNALYTVELCNADAPVYAGVAKPLMRTLETAQNVHGQDGMGDIGLPLRGRQPASGHAVNAFIETINRFAGDITLVSLGPLTNVALALQLDPSIANKVKRYVMMGGIGFGYGNVTAAAEFNIWVDPEAAKIVFDSGLPIEMVGWDISYKYATFDEKDGAALYAIGTPLARLCVDIQRVVQNFALTETKLAGFDLPDPIAMAIAIDPTITTQAEHLFVDVETKSELCRGQTVVDHLNLFRRAPNAQVVRAADRAKFVALLHEAVMAKP